MENQQPETLKIASQIELSTKCRFIGQEPFGYFKAEPFGWRDCAETDEGAIALYEAPQPQADARAVEQPRLTVRLTSFPESNGKRNWTAMFVRAEPWDGLIGNAGGITIKHGELWNRVAYEAERARFLIGERDTEPYIRDYGTDIQTPDEWLGEGKARAAIAKATGAHHD